MRLIHILAAAALLLVALPSSVLAGPNDWPGGCEANPMGTKQAVRVYDKTGFSGYYDRECGNFWASFNSNGNCVGTMCDDMLYDSNLGNATGFGTIEDLNDAIGSFVLFNRSQNAGACFTFFVDTGMSTGWLDVRYSLWIPPRSGNMKYFFAKVRKAEGLGWQSAWSSLHAWRPSNPAYDTQAECNANRNTNGGADYDVVWGYKLTDGRVVIVSP